MQDPVGLGLVKSLSHPGGNITGFTFTNPELIGKWIELLADVAPRITRAALIFNPKTTPFFYNFIHEIKASRQSGATDLIALPVGTTGETETAINTLAKQPGSTLIVPPDPFNVDHIEQIAQIAGQDRLPAISVYRTVRRRRRAHGIRAGHPGYIPPVCRVCGPHSQGRGTADLPVQQPTKFEFIINLKTAKALGLTVPMIMQMTTR